MTENNDELTKSEFYAGISKLSRSEEFKSIPDVVMYGEVYEFFRKEGVQPRNALLKILECEEELLNYVAKHSHTSWSNWVKNLFFYNLKVQPDGSYLMSKETADHLKKRSSVPFDGLENFGKEMNINRAKSVLKEIIEYKRSKHGKG